MNNTIFDMFVLGLNTLYCLKTSQMSKKTHLGI